MKKFGQILALAFMLAFGYGLGQQGGILWATDYPRGGAGGGTHPVNLASDVTGELPHDETSNDSADVHGLDSGAFVLGNLDNAADFVQSANVNPGAGGTSDVAVYTVSSTTATFGTAFSAAPIVVTGSTDAVTNGAFLCRGATTTACTIGGLSNTSGLNPASVGYIAIGS